MYVCYYSKNLFNWPRLGSRLVIDNVATCVGFSFLQFLCSVIGFRAGAFPYKKQNTSALCHEPGEPENQYTHCPIDLDSASTRRRALSPTAAFHSFARSRSLSLSFSLSLLCLSCAVASSPTRGILHGPNMCDIYNVSGERWSEGQRERERVRKWEGRERVKSCLLKL